jgi:hypothetical protein
VVTAMLGQVQPDAPDVTDAAPMLVGAFGT